LPQAATPPDSRAGSELLRSRVAFIGHLVQSAHLATWDASLSRFSEHELGKLVDLLQGVLPPRVIATRRESSSTGACAELSLIGIAMTAAQIEQDLRHNHGRAVRAQVFAAYELAREQGCSLVGFGGYTSVATTNCVEFSEHGPGVTTGNALTVGLAYEAMVAGMQELELPLATANAAVCGATGNIGQVYAALLAGATGSLHLVGRAGSLRRLRAVSRAVAKESPSKSGQAAPAASCLADSRARTPSSARRPRARGISWSAWRLPSAVHSSPLATTCRACSART
jgi:predicted amino acid dehydrogenase